MASRRRVLVSGASSGIGKATAIRFAQEGWDVCLSARRENLLNEIRESLPEGDHLVCAGDTSDGTVVEAVGAAVQNSWGRLDALVNSAGAFLGAHSVDSPLAGWRKPLDMMVNGAVNLTRTGALLMTED